jgi:arylsulfatase
VVDFAPTILELAGMQQADIPLPSDAPELPGRSFAPALGGGACAERSHVYWNHSGNRALRVGDWKIVSANSTAKGTPDDPWALYDLATDRCEMVDLADAQPEKLAEMTALWQQYEDTYRQHGTPE